MYVSTRGMKGQVQSAEVIIAGIAADGGLFVPTSIPSIEKSHLEHLIQLTYQERAVQILEKFLPDYFPDEVTACVEKAYNNVKFDDSAIAPLISVGDSSHVLELWHGPTSAFKDMALQLLPQLMSTALKKTGEKAEIVILVATSGDTGKAALEGFKDVPQIKIIVFYPQTGVSQIQRLQMVTQQGENVAVIAVKGNFDDAQTGVKNIFNTRQYNNELNEKGFQLSSANSINWGRLVPQIVYYFSAYADLVKQGRIQLGDSINFVVPTGNFGNILAGYYAKRMGLPVNRLICASNANNVLTEFLQTGIYNRNREFYQTASPSMDILISSNLERLLYHITNDNSQLILKWMNELNTTGQYTVGQEYLAAIKEVFWADWASDEQTLQTIKKVFKEYHYTMDTHTAVAWHVYEKYRNQSGDQTPTVIVSTASPYKFNENVLCAISDGENYEGKDEFFMLDELARLSGVNVPVPLASLKDATIRHKIVCGKNEMEQSVTNILGI